MNTPLPAVHLKNAWRSSHPWIFQKLVAKPEPKPKPGSIVDVLGVEGEWIGRGFYNGHSRIAVRILETDFDVPVAAGWFSRKIAEAVSLRRDVLKLDEVSNAWRVVHAEGDGLSGLVVDRYDDLLVVEFFSAGMFRHRDWIYEALKEQFPGARFYSFAEEHVQKQESFDFRGTDPPSPAIITENGVRFRADPAGAHKTGFFADQRENREWLSQQVEGRHELSMRSRDLTELTQTMKGLQRRVVAAILGVGLLIVAAVLYALEAGGPRVFGVPAAAWIAGLGGLWALVAAWPRR